MSSGKLFGLALFIAITAGTIVIAQTGNTKLGTGALNKNTTGDNNTAVGVHALTNNNTGSHNTAVGRAAMANNTSGNYNTSVGKEALVSNKSGDENTAVGHAALASILGSSHNTAVGTGTLRNSLNGDSNTAVGDQALDENINGNNNTAIGVFALKKNTGSDNTAIGYRAGEVSTGNSNVYISHPGIDKESNTTRIGVVGKQLRTFVSGISSTAVTGAPVVVDGSGQLGVVPSSRQYKEDIRGLANVSTDLLKLRPVSFRYKTDAVTGTRSRSYGLIAEEVAEVFPDLVTRGPNGLIETVRYDQLTVLLLKELQTQRRELEVLRSALRISDGLGGHH